MVQCTCIPIKYLCTSQTGPWNKHLYY